MTLKPADMESCTEKKRCLQGVNAGTAYTPGDECADRYTFNAATCDCDPDECFPCGEEGSLSGFYTFYFYGPPGGQYPNGWEETINSHTRPELSEPYSCRAATSGVGGLCYQDFIPYNCDGTLSSVTTPKIVYCDTPGCWENGGSRLTYDRKVYLQESNCHDVLCPADGEAFDCDLCECAAEWDSITYKIQGNMTTIRYCCNSTPQDGCSGCTGDIVSGYPQTDNVTYTEESITITRAEWDARYSLGVDTASACNTYENFATLASTKTWRGPGRRWLANDALTSGCDINASADAWACIGRCDGNLNANFIDGEEVITYSYT